jgi:hypothetical protein
MPVSPSPTYSTMYSSMRVCEDLIKVYPTRFHDIEAAKDYIAYKCGYDLENTFDNKLVFLVAIKAYDSKEFYLEILPPNRNALRSKFMGFDLRRSAKYSQRCHRVRHRHPAAPDPHLAEVLRTCWRSKDICCQVDPWRGRSYISRC